MIPLRILHAVHDPGGWDAAALALLADQLAHDQHESARLLPDKVEPGPGPEALRIDRGWWRWWTGGRTRALRLVAAWSPDLIHLHGIAALPLALDVARLLGLKVVVSVFGHEPLDQLRRLRDPRIAWVLTPSGHHRALCISEAGIPRDRVAPLPCGVPIPAIPPTSEDERWTLGVLVDDRAGGDALEHLADAAASAHAGGSALRLRVRVPAALRDGVKSLAERHPAVVQVAPDGPYEDFLAGIDVLAVPSPRGVHTLPLLQAMALARPIIAPAVGGAAELVPDGNAGFLAPPDDRRALIDILTTLDLPSRRAALARGARRLADERFAIATVAQATVELYRAALGGEGTGHRAEITTVYRRITERLH